MHLLLHEADDTQHILGVHHLNPSDIPRKRSAGNSIADRQILRMAMSMPARSAMASEPFQVQERLDDAKA